MAGNIAFAEFKVFATTHNLVVILIILIVGDFAERKLFSTDVEARAPCEYFTLVSRYFLVI